jgi:hypothetical protein
VSSGFGNPIYWTTCNYNYSLYNFTTHKPKTLPSEFCIRYCPSWQTNLHFCLLGSMLNSGLRNSPYSLSLSVSTSVLLLLLCNLPVALLRGLFADSIGDTSSKGSVVMETISCFYENNCLPRPYNGNACVRCLGNDSPIQIFRHFVTVCMYV